MILSVGEIPKPGEVKLNCQSDGGLHLVLVAVDDKPRSISVVCSGCNRLVNVRVGVYAGAGD